MAVRAIKIIITIVSLAIVVVHLRWPQLKIDSITLTLLVVAAVPWLAQLFKSLELPGGWKFEFQELRKVAQDQANTTLHQTLATIISWVQAEEIRQSRGLLYDLERTQTISKLPPDRWEEEWKQAADRVSQAFNSAAIIAKLDPRLQKVWISPTRRAILRSWRIVKPRVEERRKEEGDLWQEFDWLAEAARKYCNPDEETASSTRDVAEGNLHKG